MRSFKILILVFTTCFFHRSAASQNVLLNIITQNSGVISKGGTGMLEVTICNTSPVDSVPAYKLRPQISIPEAIVNISPTGHTLPEGWSIVSNSGTTIRLSNGTDNIPANGCRTILIAIKGIAAGGPSTVSGNLLFSNGEAPGSAPGGPTKGDNPADNGSTSTFTIRK